MGVIIHLPSTMDIPVRKMNGPFGGKRPICRGEVVVVNLHIPEHEPLRYKWSYRAPINGRKLYKLVSLRLFIEDGPITVINIVNSYNPYISGFRNGFAWFFFHLPPPLSGKYFTLKKHW